MTATGSGTATVPSSSAIRPSANLEAFSTLMASRRPDLHLALVEGGVGPGPAAGGPVAHGVGAVLLEQGERGHHVALGLGHLLAVRVEHPAGDGGVASRAASRAPARDRTTVENSQVRMISWAWGRRSIGKTRANRSGSSSQPPAIWGVSDEVAQVSMTSGSPTNPPGPTPLVLGVARRARRWTGRRAGGPRRAKIGRSKSVSPSSSTGYQTGKGTPKKRCRLMFQSPLSPSTQARSGGPCRAGASAAPAPLARRRSPEAARVRTNHWRDETISSGRSPLLVELDRMGDRGWGRR